MKPTGDSSPDAEVAVPYVEIRIGKPVAYASIICPWPITRPTCPGEVGVPSAPAKNTRSPGCTWEAEDEDQYYLQKHPDGETCHFPRPGWKLPHRETAS